MWDANYLLIAIMWDKNLLIAIDIETYPIIELACDMLVLKFERWEKRARLTRGWLSVKH